MPDRPFFARVDKWPCCGGPFLLLNIPSAHFLWFTTAVLFQLGCRLLGGQGSFRQVLQVTGIAMYVYVAIGLINYLHLLWPLPSITLEASAFYRPSLGVGQLAVFLWLALVLFQAARQVHGLPAWGAVLTAPLPILVSLLLYLASAAFFFRLVPKLLPGDWHPQDWLAMANGAYTAATVGLTGTMAWVTRRWWLTLRR